MLHEEGQRVLIETSWNVKRFNLQWYAKGGFRINRNIVECKE